VASFFKRLKRRLRDEASSKRFAPTEFNRPAEGVSEVERSEPRRPLDKKAAMQVLTLAAMLGTAPLRGVKGGPRG
jgi:hypothetical protein